MTLNASQQIDSLRFGSVASSTGSVELDFGSIVLNAGQSVTYSRPQVAIDFDQLVAGGSAYVEDSMQLATDSSLAVNDNDTSQYEDIYYLGRYELPSHKSVAHGA